MEKMKLKERTKLFALGVINLCEKLDRTVTNQVISRQLIRCATSVGANYRAASRAKSLADFINKLKIVEEETDESMYFMELLQVKNPEFSDISLLYKEADEILAMIVASIKTARKPKAQPTEPLTRKS